MSQLENLETLQAFWATIPPDTVDLHDYVRSCDGVFCIGGHIASVHLFGVVFIANDIPALPGNFRSYIVGRNLPYHLFGDRDLFSQRGYHPADWEPEGELTDYEVAKRRIEYAKERLS